MTLTLKLPPDLGSRLEAKAAERGMSAQDFAVAVLDGAEAPPVSPSQFHTGAEVVEYWKREGLVGIWADREDIGDSVEYARQLRHGAESRGHD